MFGMDTTGQWWAVMNTVTSIWITNKILLRGSISFPRCRNPTKTTCIIKRVPLKLCSLLRYRKFDRYINDLPFHFLFSNLQLYLLILCSLGGNNRDVTAKQMDGSIPVSWSAVSSRYQDAAWCVEHHLAVPIIRFRVSVQNFGKLVTLIK
jgi:hypothetical protein